MVVTDCHSSLLISICYIQVMTTLGRVDSLVDKKLEMDGRHVSLNEKGGEGGGEESR